MKIPDYFSIRYKQKSYIVNNFKVCSTFFSKVRGLMFRSKNYKTPLLFVFNNPGIYPIHSLFCRDFLAVWFILKGKKIKFIDGKVINNIRFSVALSKKFNAILEIPLSYFSNSDGKAKI